MSTLERARPTSPELEVEALIKEARRRQRRRRGLLSAVALAAIVAAAGAYILIPGGSSRRFTDPRSSSVPPVSTARVISGGPIQVASGFGSVWVLTCERNCSLPQSFGRLFRVNDHTGQIVQRIDVTNPVAFAIGDEAVWVGHFYSGKVTRIDPRTGRTTQTISLPLRKRPGPDGSRFLPDSISAGRGAVWVASARGWLAEIDTRSGRVVSMVRAPFDVTGRVVVGAHGTWVAESVLGVGLVRPNGHRLQLRPIRDGHGRPIAVDQLAIGGGLVWVYGLTTDTSGPDEGPVLTNNAAITALDERTGKIVHQLRFPAGPYGIAYGNSALFVADYQNGHLFRIDPGYRIHPLNRVRGPGTLVAVTPGAVLATTNSGVPRRIAVPTR